MQHPIDIDGLETSVATAIDDGRVDDAIEAVSVAWPEIAATSGARLRGLIDRIPEDRWATDPWVMAGMGASSRSLDSPSRSAALPWFGTAEALMAARSTPTPLIARVRIHHAAALRSLGRLRAAESAASSARDLLADDLTLPASVRVRAQGEAALQLGLVRLQQGELDDANRLLRLALGLSERALTAAEQVECLCGLSLVMALIGDFRASADMSSAARQAAHGTGLLTSQFGAADLVAETFVAVEQDRMGDATELASQLAIAAHRSDWEPWADLAAGTVALAEGRNIEGLDLMRRCLERARTWEGDPVVRSMAELLRGAFLMHLGEFAAALHAFQSVAPSADHGVCPGRFIAGIRYKAGDSSGCLEAIADCIALGEAHNARTVTDVLLLSAAANYDLENTPTADLALDRALHLAASNRARLSFMLISTAALQRMLGRAADRTQPARVHQLLDEIKASQDSTITGGLEPLSERELDVAQHLFEDKTVSQIASDLYISSNTVKTHVRSIYRKLAANNRRDAVRRVKELGLHLDITPH